MKRKILLLQFRDDVSTTHEQQCVIEKSGLPREDVSVINAVTEEVNKSPEEILKDIDVLVIGGSGQYDLSKEPEPLMKAISKSESLVDHILENDFPTLGVCFGHQLIAQKLGANVKPVKEYAEDGTYNMRLTEEGIADKVFTGFPGEFLVQFGHKESVVDLVDKIIPLGYSENGALAAFKYKENIYGVQFHPELDAESSFFRSKLYPEYTDGKSDNEIRAGMSDAPYNDIFMKKFVDLYAN